MDNAIGKATSGISNFLKLESAGGLLLGAAAILALICSNSPLRVAYDDLLKIPVELRFGSFSIAKPLLMWINDGLMAIFFLLVGLEVKREVVEGELSTPAQVVLPVAADIIAGAGKPSFQEEVILQAWKQRRLRLTRQKSGPLCAPSSGREPSAQTTMYARIRIDSPSWVDYFVLLRALWPLIC